MSNRLIRVLGIVLAVLMAIALLSAACEPGAQLIIENRLDIDVTIVHEAIYSNGSHDRRIIAVVPAGETEETLGFMLSWDIIGNTILLEAVDEADNIAWQRSWSFEEFLKLRDVEWNIVVSPETSS